MKNYLKILIVAGLFFVPFLALYIEDNLFFPEVTGKNFAFRIIVDIIFAGWLILLLLDTQYRPKVSGIVLSFLLLLLVMFFANLLGAHPLSSFWSNLERMDGYISLVHTFMYMLVLGSVLHTKKAWDWLLNTSFIIAIVVAFYGLAQGNETERMVSTLGNAGYLAIYMLFHVFFAIWLFISSQNIVEKVLYAAVIPLFIFVMFETGTRGTFVGLLIGLLVMVFYIAMVKQESLNYRKFIVGISIALLAIVVSFIVIKDSELIQNNKNLSRIANISSEDLEGRFIIWSIAWQGIKEKPVLGYGQSNFNYVYNKHYDPRNFNAQWFDRSHNFILEWLVTGGFLGLIVYLSIFVWCAWYLLFRPMLNKADNSFTVMERGVLLGILVAYLTQSLVTFDTVISYIFLAISLALITSRVGFVPAKITAYTINPLWVTRLATPVITLILVSVIYFLYAPTIIAAFELKALFNETNQSKRLAAYDRALAQNSFAHQQITELLAILETPKVISSSSLPNNIKQRHYALTAQQLEKLILEKPGDAQVHMHTGYFYQSIGQNNKAAEQMSLARQLSPLNQKIIQHQGFIALSQYKAREAHDFFKIAFELDKNNLQARIDYAASLLILHKTKEVIALIDSDEVREGFANSNHLIDTAKKYGHTEFANELLSYRVYGKSLESQVEKN